MDQLLSNLIPTNRTGNDGFNWWIGQVEGVATDEKNNKGGYRYKVRIIGDHPKSKTTFSTDELPWATVVMPVTAPFVPDQTTGASPQLKNGCWVVGFFMDPERQKPIIMGSVGQTPGATTKVKYKRPDSDEALETEIDVDEVSGTTDAVIPPENRNGGEVKDGDENRTGSGLGDGSSNEDGLRISRGSRDDDPGAIIEPLKVCVTKAQKCDDVDLKTKMTYIMGDFLRDIQKSNGKVGTYLVDKYTGRLLSLIHI